MQLEWNPCVSFLGLSACNSPAVRCIVFTSVPDPHPDPLVTNTDSDLDLDLARAPDLSLF
jgi:hypothetical protein